MLSSINWLRQLIARDQAKQPQLKNQLTKSHKSSQPTIGRDTKFLERLQSVIVVDGATHTQKDDMESNGGSLENVAEIFVLFFCGVQLAGSEV
jgi:hypothetical protein